LALSPQICNQKCSKRSVYNRFVRPITVF
jgi:hypothetical protein